MMKLIDQRIAPTLCALEQETENSGETCQALRFVFVLCMAWERQGGREREREERSGEQVWYVGEDNDRSGAGKASKEGKDLSSPLKAYRHSWRRNRVPSSFSQYMPFALCNPAPLRCWMMQVQMYLNGFLSTINRFITRSCICAIHPSTFSGLYSTVSGRTCRTSSVMMAFTSSGWKNVSS